MTKVNCDQSVSVDGFVAGSEQGLDTPLGKGGENLHRWMFEQPEVNAAERETLTAAAAFVMGRNMLGPGHGEWDLDWTGWRAPSRFTMPGVRPHPSPAGVRGDEGWRDLSLRDRRYQ